MKPSQKIIVVIFTIACLNSIVLATSWSFNFDTTTPAYDESIASGDDRIRESKLAIQERENVDHFWPLADNMVQNPAAGTHRQITFHVPIATPTPAADEGLIYTKEVTIGGQVRSMLHWIDELGYEKQMMTLSPSDAAACFNLEKKDLLVNKANLVDDDTIEVNASTGLALKAATATTGVKKGNLATDAGVFCDQSTLTIDGTAGVKIKTPAVPAAGGDFYPDAIASPVIAWGTYTGIDSNKTLKVGFNIKHLLIKNITDSNSAVEAIVATAATYIYRVEDGAAYADITITGDTVTLTGNKARTNDAGKNYVWWAEGTRP